MGLQREGEEEQLSDHGRFPESRIGKRGCVVTGKTLGALVRHGTPRLVTAYTPQRTHGVPHPTFEGMQDYGLHENDKRGH